MLLTFKKNYSILIVYNKFIESGDTIWKEKNH